MKKHFQAASAISVLSVFWVCTVFAGNNLLTNGGFEEGDLGQLGSV